LEEQYQDLARWRGTMKVQAFESKAGVIITRDKVHALDESQTVAGSVPADPANPETALITSAFGSECVVESAEDSGRDLNQTLAELTDVVAAPDEPVWRCFPP
jgi:hypothetical protein